MKSNDQQLARWGHARASQDSVAKRRVDVYGGTGHGKAHCNGRYFFFSSFGMGISRCYRMGFDHLFLFSGAMLFFLSFSFVSVSICGENSCTIISTQRGATEQWSAGFLGEIHSFGLACISACQTSQDSSPVYTKIQTVFFISPNSYQYHYYSLIRLAIMNIPFVGVHSSEWNQISLSQHLHVSIEVTYLYTYIFAVA